jgi:aminoglycoside phosphotransferase family enzyme/predicted kinase
MNDSAVLDMELDLAAQSRMVEALRRTLGADVRLMQTHISYVLLTGARAYKIKKAVDMGFLDFTTLDKREFYCREELRLNQAFAPEIYLDVVPITGTPEAPRLGGGGVPIDYAVEMREFAQDALATAALARGEITGDLVDVLAQRVADAHAAARPDCAAGDPAEIETYALRNFERIRASAADAVIRSALDSLAAFTRAEFRRVRQVMSDRRAGGRVRECHGDLHLGNIAILDGQPVLFDCIEFSAPLRVIDVMSDVAFLAMDLAERGRPDLAHRFVNAYVEITGDYEGLRVLRFYLVYRAMVRAMVACERARQTGDGAGLDDARRYVALAQRYAHAASPAMVITFGFAGCGKTTASLAFVERAGAVRVRTDLERKRLHKLGPTDRDWQRLAPTMYKDGVTRWVYLRVLALARTVIAAGFPVIVDGTFLKRWQREAFREAAAALGVPFAIVAFEAAPATLRKRIRARMEANHDASDADVDVLEAQLRSHDALDDSERTETTFIDSETSLAAMRSPERWAGVVERLALA